MTALEIERNLRKNYRSRNRRLLVAMQDGASCTNQIRISGEKCSICNRSEHGGGLFTYRMRDGSGLLVGHRCAEYLDHLGASSLQHALTLLAVAI